jgi:hypothetical protein
MKTPRKGSTDSALIAPRLAANDETRAPTPVRRKRPLVTPVSGPTHKYKTSLQTRIFASALTRFTAIRKFPSANRALSRISSRLVLSTAIKKKNLLP